ncbi:MAG: hypothetical protein DCC58_18145 [Chloroflexi bacterium]|nr:MAG: hypothetical protein DCC58_18145 [Chloroflexota bacterium]
MLTRTKPQRRAITGRVPFLLVTVALLAASLLAACGTPEPPPRERRAAATQTARATDPANTLATRTPIPAPALAATTTPVPPTATATATGTPDNRAATALAQTPTPLPGPVPGIGDTIDTQGWQLTVTAIDLFPRIGDHRASGIYLYVKLRITNTSGAAVPFPFEGLVVVDQRNTSYGADIPATTESLRYDFNRDIAAPIDNGQTLDLAVAFDIPLDATNLILTTPTRIFTIVLGNTEYPK